MPVAAGCENDAKIKENQNGGPVVFFYLTNHHSFFLLQQLVKLNENINEIKDRM